jgi:hypothetical protein
MIVKPPSPLPHKHPVITGRDRVFLAGSIEQGAAEEWQALAGAELVKQGAVVFNPRRDNWDPSWVQSASNDQFRGQVEWELEAMELADIILMHFDPQTKSPITLLELGLYAENGKLVVSCPVGFWRLGNVEIVCGRYGVPLFHSLKEALGEIGKRLALTKRGHALREARDLISKLPVCNREFAHEAFCGKVKGHTDPCELDDRLTKVLGVQEALK